MMVLREADSGAASPGAARPGGAISETREKPTGDVRPLPRARNQVREPRRRRHPPAPAQDTRGKGTRSPSGKERR